MRTKEPERIGRVVKVLGNGRYEVEVEVEGVLHTLQCYLSGRMRQYAISILAEDKVRFVVPEKSTLGRITYREK